MPEIRILLADDHAVLRQGIAQVLNVQPDMTVVAQADNGRQALELARQHQPDIALLDINMPVMNGIDATLQIAAELPETRIIILTMYRSDDYIFEAIKNGASGYLLKEVELEELLDSIRIVARGEAVIDPAIASRVLAEFRAPSDALKSDNGEKELAPRDTEILRLLAGGRANREIAEELGISEKTVRNRLSLVFRQLHLKNRTDAALYALRAGLVDDLGEDSPNDET